MSTIASLLALLEGLFVFGALAQAAMARLAGMQIEVFTIGLFGPPLFRRGRVQIAAFPLGAFVRVAGLHATETPVGTEDPKAFFNRPFLLRALVVLAWPLGAQAFVVLLDVMAIAMAGLSVDAVIVEEVRPGSAAELAGLQRGDEIVSVANRAELLRVVADANGAPVTLEVVRGERRMSVVAQPQADETGQPRLGIILNPSKAVRVGLGTAIVEGAPRPFAVQAEILGAWVTVLRGTTQAEVMGPVQTVAVVDQMPAAARARVRTMFAAYFVLLSLIPWPFFPGAQLLLFCFGWRSRRRRAPEAARDAGVAEGSPYRHWPILGAVLVVGALIIGGPFLIVLAPMTMLGASSDSPIPMAVSLALPLALLLPPLRASFKQVCPVCHRREARPVRSSPRTACVACGSSWRWA